MEMCLGWGGRCSVVVVRRLWSVGFGGMDTGGMVWGLEGGGWLVLRKGMFVCIDSQNQNWNLAEMSSIRGSLLPYW